MQMQSLSADLSGKKAFVTGSGQGMGQAIALTLAQRGAKVMVHDRTLAATQITLELIREQGGSAYAIAADFSECTGLEKMMTEVVSQLGGLDILVNNAGIGDLVLLQDMDEAFWDRMQNINLKAPAMITKYALETMRNNPTGGVCCISPRPMPNLRISSFLPMRRQRPVYSALCVVLLLRKARVGLLPMRSARVGSIHRLRRHRFGTGRRRKVCRLIRCGRR